MAKKVFTDESLSTFIDEIKAYSDSVGSTKADKSQGIFYVVGGGTTDTTNKKATWTGSHDDISAYYDGLVIAYKVGTAGSTTTTLNINNLGAVTVVRNASTAISTAFPVNSVVFLIYTIDSGTAYWKVADYDSNSYAYVRQYYTTSDANYPLLFKYDSGLTTTTNYVTKYTRTANNMYVNPSTGVITAGGFVGDLTGNATTATKATQDASGNTITSTYETKTNANAKLTEAKTYSDTNLSTAKSYTDTAISNLINSAPSTLDTLGEIATAMEENADVVEALESAIGTKASATHTHGNITNAGAIGTTSGKAVITTTNGVLTTGTVPIASGGTGATTAAAALTNLGITATAAELNYMDGVTSSVQTQLDTLTTAVNGKANSSHTHSDATTSAAGFMSATDKTKLDGIATGANKTVVDDTISTTSTNPLQNKVITTKFQDIEEAIIDIENSLATKVDTLEPINIGGSVTFNDGNEIFGISDYSITQTHYQQFLQNKSAPLQAGDYVFQLDGLWENGDNNYFVQYSYFYLDSKYYVSVLWESDGCGIDETYSESIDVPDYITTGAMSGTTIGSRATAEGFDTTASGNFSHAEGSETIASGSSSHAEGDGTTASGDFSHAEGGRTTASGNFSHAEGYSTIASGSSSHAGGYCTIANNYQYVVGRFNANTTAPTSITDTTSTTGLFIVGIGTSESARSNGFRVNPAGKVYGTGTFGTSGADYAEYFEWFDGNPNNEDRRGRFVTLEGDKIRYATANDDYILGVVSADPSVAGDVYSEDWHNRYLKDVFGSKIVEVVEVEETTNEDGEIIPAHTERRWVLNPDYNPDVKYVSREERPEWAAIGIVGKLVVVDDGTCQVNSYCYPNVDGIATASQEKTNYRVIERLDDTHIRIFIR